MTFLKNNPPASATIAGTIKCATNTAPAIPTKAIYWNANTSDPGDVTFGGNPLGSNTWVVPPGGTWFVWYFGAVGEIKEMLNVQIVAGGSTVSVQHGIYIYAAAWRVQ